MFSSTLYRVSPPWTQNLLVSLRGWTYNALREGPQFRRILQEIEATQWYSATELAELQWTKLTSVLQLAANHVPYYRDLFAEHGIDVSQIRSPADFTRIPFLTKQIVQQQPERLLAPNIKGPRTMVNTSGSTGTPLAIAQNLDAVNRENAFIWRQLTWAGYRRGEPRAWLRGEMVVPSDQNRPPYWRINAADRMLMLSSFHISPQTAAAYIDVLQEFDPVLIQAYPSAMAFLARYLHASNQQYRGRRLRAAVVTSETLHAEDARLIEERFGCRIFEQYGTAERVTMVQTCEHGTRHLLLDFGYTELIAGADGRPEVVGTAFNNLVMPLIRYRSGDALELADDTSTCACGRAFPKVRKIHGRMDDYILTPDGRRIARLGFIFQGIAHIAEGQIVQDDVNEVVLKVVPVAGFNADDEQQLIANARERLGHDIHVCVAKVDAIPRTKNGKLRNVICNVRPTGVR